MVNTNEGTFTTRDGTKLYTKTWEPNQPSHIHLVFIHGFSDHINAYYSLFPILSGPSYNITVHAFDQRGWGRSVYKDSERGLTGHTHQVESDIADFIYYVSSNIKTRTNRAGNEPKLFLMGHSMGGAESLVYLLSQPESFAAPHALEGPPLPISGLLVEAPHIAFPPGSQPSPLLVFAGRLAGKLLPRRQMVQTLDASSMSRDPKVCESWKNDSLCHDTGTLQGLAGLLDRAAYLDAVGSMKSTKECDGLAGKLPCPVFWAHGTGDKVCDFVASKRLFDRLTKEGGSDVWHDGNMFKAYDGAYHKLHAEPDGTGEEFASDVGRWIVDVAGGGEGARPKNSTMGQVPIQQAVDVTPDTAEVEAEGVKSRL